MVSYKVGQVIPEFVGHEEGALFDMADDGATMIVFFDRPDQKEIEQFKSEHSFEIRFVQIKNVIMVLAKIGNLNWIDSPYTPHLSKYLTRLESPEHGCGLALTILLVDCFTGNICSIRLLGLSERFTKSLFNAVLDVWKKEWNKLVYATNMNRIFMSYSTKDLVKMSVDYCKIN